MTVIVAASGPMRSTEEENTSMSMSGAANTTAPIRSTAAAAVPRVNLAQRLHRQHGADAVRDDMDARDSPGWR